MDLDTCNKFTLANCSSIIQEVIHLLIPYLKDFILYEFDGEVKDISWFLEGDLTQDGKPSPSCTEEYITGCQTQKKLLILEEVLRVHFDLRWEEEEKT